MSEQCPINVPCQVEGQTQTPLSDVAAAPIVTPNALIKVPVVLAERTLQIVVESTIPLNPPAVEIKRVLKNVFLTQCKLVPVAFTPVAGTSYRRVTRAKLFVQGFIRKNIEYASDKCNGNLIDRIANVNFSGFADLADGDFLTQPIIAASSDTTSHFINPKNGDLPRLDKYFFENSVFYNEQPFCELISAKFFELDFSPCPTNLNEPFDTLREKIVLDLTLKVLQVQQVRTREVGL
ncbi:CsxC family protein [Bacillus sp. NPDC094106]|uniref:CsxC family protein n=1 Tax=Bacillus sp. NPDC094106 TaxID=3363949 RepID=UPI003802F9A8